MSLLCFSLPIPKTVIIIHIYNVLGDLLMGSSMWNPDIITIFSLLFICRRGGPSILSPIPGPAEVAPMQRHKWLLSRQYYALPSIPHPGKWSLSQKQQTSRHCSCSLFHHSFSAIPTDKAKPEPLHRRCRLGKRGIWESRCPKASFQYCPPPIRQWAELVPCSATNYYPTAPV